jgi:hypothetical protein
MIIKEFLPNPVGNDKEGEYIKLLNDGSLRVNLSGWSVKDASGKIFKLSGFLDAGEELILPYSQTKIVLNNNGERVLLYDASGNLVDELSYSGQAKEGELIEQNQELAISNQQLEISENYPITNSQLPVTNIIFVDFLTAAILAGLGLYIVLQAEKKLGQLLF